MNAAANWLCERVGTAPPELLARMLEAVADAPDGPVYAMLGEAALSRLRLVLASGGERAAALDLLAADALLTHALAAAAEDGEATLLEAVADAPDGPVYAMLGEAALSRLRLVLASGGERAAALDLLAADALLTHALAAAAEDGEATLLEAVAEFGAARCATLLEDAA
jgi:hypothetical protein